jgi:hypothetical protein
MFTSSHHPMRRYVLYLILGMLLTFLMGLLWISPLSVKADGGPAPSPTPTPTLAVTTLPSATSPVQDSEEPLIDLFTQEAEATNTSDVSGQLAPLVPSPTAASSGAARSTLSCWPLAVGLVIVLVILAFFRMQGRTSGE